MAATVHNLFPEPPGSAPPAAAAAAPMSLPVELRKTCLELLEELARRMFDNADDVLFEMSERAANDAERRGYFDTMRVLRLDRRRVLREFLQRLASGFDATSRPVAGLVGGADSEELSIQPTEELEERIALGNLASKVESCCKDHIYELGRRLQAAREKGVAIPPDVLSPARICDAFGAAAGTLDASFEIKLVLYKLFDRLLSRDLEQVYQAALDLLARHGYVSQRAGGTGRAAVAMAALDRLREQGLDPQSLRGLGDPAAERLADALQLHFDRADGPRAEAATQRMSMAGHLFDELLAEPHLSQPLRSAFEPLRYPLYRRALNDPALFANTAHPLRRMLADLVDLAAATQTGEAPASRFRSALAMVLNQTDTGVRDAPASEANVDWDGFLRELKAQSEARRVALLQHVRRLVAQELDLRMVGHVLPPPVLALLRSGIGPLLAVRLLRHGRGSAEYRNAEALLDRVLASVDVSAGPATETEQLAREPLVAELVAELRDIGLAEPKIDLLIGGLRGSYRQHDRPAEDVPGETLPLTELERARLIAPISVSDLATEASEPVTVSKDAADAASTSDAPLPEAADPIAAAPAVARLPEVPATNGEGIEIPAAATPELLEKILIPEAWFRVYDPARGATRWLKLASYYIAQDSVSFHGFDDSTRLNLRASRFAADLAAGRSEPINPAPATRVALDELRGKPPSA
jgi:hypothetical protein